MTVTQRLYAAAAPIWQACHDHPFVKGIGDGSLDREKFQYFLLQDYLYLFDYAKVFAWGVVKAQNPELMRFFSANVDAILGGEMKTHRAYMARLGITEEQVFRVKPALANLSYTGYMLSAAACGGPAEIVAAILIGYGLICAYMIFIGMAACDTGLPVSVLAEGALGVSLGLGYADTMRFIASYTV